MSSLYAVVVSPPPLSQQLSRASSNPPPVILINAESVALRRSCLIPLQEWLEHDPQCLEWVKERRGPTVTSEMLDRARKTLLRQVLEPFVRSIQTQIESEKLDSEKDAFRIEEIWQDSFARFDAPNAYGKYALIRDVVRTIIPFDCADVLFLKKMVPRDDCESGMIWCTQEALVAIDPEPKFDRQKHVYTISKAYVEIQNHHDALREFLIGMTQTVFPSWLKATTPAYKNYVTEKDVFG